MSKPLVSLLMAAYNNVRFIKAAIDSVKNQTYENWELVILNDGSTDGTYELAQKLAEGDDRIKVHTNEKNIGVNLTMLKLSKLAKGEYFAHFDSDDMLERWAVEEMVMAFEKHPTATLIYSDMVQIGMKNEIQVYRANKDFNRSEIYNYGWMHMGMYKSSVLNEIQGYNEKLGVTSGCNDGDLFMQIAEKYEVVHHPKVLYMYRAHDGGHTSAKKPECQKCPANDDCNYIRIWANSLGYDQKTLTPLKVENGREDSETFVQQA